MGNQLEKVQKIKNQLEKLRITLDKYQQIFEQSGLSDAPELKRIQGLQDKIQKSAKRLTILENKSKQNTQDISERPKLRGDFTISASGNRTVLTPDSPNGGTIYFFYGYTGSSSDVEMRDQEVAHIQDDVANAANRGFRVVYDETGTKADFENAIYDSSTVGIYWSGHGEPDGALSTSDGGVVDPFQLDQNRISSQIKFLLFPVCYSAKLENAWRHVIGGNFEFQGWEDLTNVRETNDFATSRPGDDMVSHGGSNPNMELDDYINNAANAMN